MPSAPIAGVACAEPAGEFGVAGRAADSSMMRKSLPQACALTNGMGRGSQTGQSSCSSRKATTLSVASLAISSASSCWWPYVLADTVKVTRWMLAQGVAFHDVEAKVSGVEHVKHGGKHAVLVDAAHFVEHDETLPLAFGFEHADELERGKYDDGGQQGFEVEPGAAGHADGGDYPDRGSGGHA